LTYFADFPFFLVSCVTSCRSTDRFGCCGSFRTGMHTTQKDSPEPPPRPRPAPVLLVRVRRELPVGRHPAPHRPPRRCHGNPAFDGCIEVLCNGSEWVPTTNGILQSLSDKFFFLAQTAVLILPYVVSESFLNLRTLLGQCRLPTRARGHQKEPCIERLEPCALSNGPGKQMWKGGGRLGPIPQLFSLPTEPCRQRKSQGQDILRLSKLLTRLWCSSLVSRIRAPGSLSSVCFSGPLEQVGGTSSRFSVLVLRRFTGSPLPPAFNDFSLKAKTHKTHTHTHTI